MPGEIVIIGSGNVAWHLTESLHTAGHSVSQIFARNPDDAIYFSRLNSGIYTSDINVLNPNADLYILSVNDDAIVKVAEKLPFKLKNHQMMVHCSGAIPSDILSTYTINYGCLWPLQSLIRATPIATRQLPLVLTGANDYVKKQLTLLATLISDQFTWIDDERKSKLHLAAVIVNNFTNHLYTMTYDFCRLEHTDFKLLIPLIRETAEKLTKDLPEKNQTGPAIRNDKEAIKRHLIHIKKYPDLLKLYHYFSESIIKKYHNSENN